ncbi:MAG: hypothetical protein J6L81_05895 [Clostridia bacterium]|nr:hypothetical protein [Clostridia bacterium]
MSETNVERESKLSVFVDKLAEKCGGKNRLMIAAAIAGMIVVAAVVLCVIMCSGAGEEEPVVQNQPGVEVTHGETEPQKEEEAVKVEYTQVHNGDVASYDFIEIRFENVGQGEELNTDVLSYSPTNSSNHLFWLTVTMKNTTGNGFDGWYYNTISEITFDNKYTYEVQPITLDFTLAPLVESKVYLCAEVPPVVLESCKNVSVKLAFNENFESYDIWETEMDNLSCRIEYTNAADVQ